MMTSRYDCLVLGGGPAGCATAALVAAAGCRTLLVEREKIPRYRIGESLLPAAYPTLRRLGLVERLNTSPFPKKYGVSFCSFDGRQSQAFQYSDRDSSGAAQSWQVLRSEFDQMLWGAAQSHGAECRERTRVTQLLGDQQTVEGAVLQDADGNLSEIQAQVVVDATGHHAVVAEKLDLPVVQHSPQRSAIWGYYENAYRDAGHEGAMTHIFRSRDRRQWFWYVPLQGNVVSVGVVGAAEHLLQGRGRPATVFEEELVDCPIVLERLVDARLIGELRASGPLQAVSRSGAGAGWVLVGDALATLDPVFCTGVSLALRSGELAADAIVAALSHQQVTAAQLGQFLPGYLLGLGRLRRLSEAFYNPRFSFRLFLEDHGDQYGNLVDVLAGHVFDSSADEVIEQLVQWLESQTATRPKTCKR